MTEEEEKLNEQEDKKTSLITFAKLNKYFLIPFIVPIFSMSTNYCIALLIETNTIKKLEFLGVIYIEITYMLVGLLHFIPYFRKNIGKGNDSKRTNISNKYFQRKQKKPHILLYLSGFILLLGFLLDISELISVIISNKTKFEFRLSLFFFVPFFAKLILKENMYKHHYLSLIIAIFGVIFLLIPVALNITKEDILSNILGIISGVSIALFCILIKYVNEKYYYSPIFLSFLFGLSSIIMHCIGFIIYSLIKYHDFSYFKDFFDFSQAENKSIIYSILILVLGTIYNLLYLLAIYYFSPILILVSDMISPFLMWIALTINEGEKLPDIITNPIGYIIVLIASFIYNEIIILNFCGFNENTKIVIEKRVVTESIEMQIPEITQCDILNNDNEDENFIISP